MSTELRRCPLCEAADLVELYVTRDRHYGIPGEFRVVRCTACSLVFLNPMYSDDELKVLYPTDYYAYQDQFSSSLWKELLKAVCGYRLGTCDPRFQRPGTMLDVGCGSGWFLEKMRAKGWTTYGVEINESAAKLGRESRGLEIMCGTVQDAKFPAEFFDYIRSNHSFEHMSCPDGTLQEVHRILKPGGKLHIGVPNFEGLNSRVFKKYWWYVGAPVHPFNYSVNTLSRMLAKHRFAIEKVTYNSDWSGVLGSVQIWTNRKGSRKSCEGMLINNSALRVGCHWIAKCLDLFRAGDAIEITAARAEES